MFLQMPKPIEQFLGTPKEKRQKKFKSVINVKKDKKIKTEKEDYK